MALVIGLLNSLSSPVFPQEQENAENEAMRKEARLYKKEGEVLTQAQNGSKSLYDATQYSENRCTTGLDAKVIFRKGP